MSDSKVTILAAVFGGTPVLVPQNFVKFYLFLWLLTLKILWAQLKRLKSLNFGRLVWGVNPHY